jgi:hypothetical protein
MIIEKIDMEPGMFNGKEEEISLIRTADFDKMLALIADMALALQTYRENTSEEEEDETGIYIDDLLARATQ